MKSMLILTLVLSVTNLFAAGKNQSDFIPSKCSQDEIAQIRVCFGSKLGHQGLFLTIFDVFGLPTTYQVLQNHNPSHQNSTASKKTKPLVLVNEQRTLNSELSIDPFTRQESFKIYLNDGRIVTFVNFKAP